MSKLRTRTLVGVLLPLTAIAACSDDGGAGGGSADEAEETPAEQATVQVEDSDLGEIVVDAEGKTLYVFLADEGGESTCYEDCEASWPPLTVAGEPVAGDGIETSVLGTTERDDGTLQVTLDGQPLYYFAADETVDDVNGQGVGDVWYVVAPDGAPIRK
jgi:predicted lipoprotein with Yx(FWY)xxD motif